MYTYTADVIRVIDGDTIKLKIDLGFRTFIEANCRIYGINAPELHSKVSMEKIKAQEAKEWLEQELIEGTIVTIESKKLDKYGRPLVHLYYTLGDKIVSIADRLIKKGHAVKMEGYNEK